MTHQAGISLGLTLRVLAESPTDGAPVVLKAVRGGYDGRGVWMLAEPPTELPGPDVYVEARVPLVHELSIQVARRPGGETRTWPAVETVQDDGICVEVVAPAPRTSPT